ADGHQILDERTEAKAGLDELRRIRLAGAEPAKIGDALEENELAALGARDRVPGVVPAVDDPFGEGLGAPVIPAEERAAAHEQLAAFAELPLQRQPGLRVRLHPVTD